MKKSRLLLFFSLTFLLFSCSDNDDEKYTLELDKTSVSIDINGGKDWVLLTSNDNWQITGIPEWLSVTPSAGDPSDLAEITIVATENFDLERRNVSLEFTCGSISKQLEVEQFGLIDLAPFIKLSEQNLPMNDKGEVKKIKLTTNTSWEITHIPQWISVTPISGKKSEEITITVTENKEPEGRSFDLTFSSDKARDIVKVSQIGLKDYLRSPSLPIFSFKHVQFTGEQDKYDINALNLFVNPAIKERIYLGNLIAYDAGLPNTQIPEFTGYTFNPITISTSAIGAGVLSKTYVPSWAEQNLYAREIIAKKPKQNLSFTSDNGTIDFYDYRRLYTLGMANMGIKLDEVVSGSSYTTKEMTKKYGLIFSFKQTWFSLDMDIPDKLIKEDLKDADKAKGVAYVSSVFYGRIGLLIVESDTYFGDVKIAVNKVIAGEALTASETTLIEQSDISYVYFDNNTQVQVKKGRMDAVNAYKEDILKGNTENVYPVGFGLSSFTDHGMNTISFTVKVPK